MPFGSSLGGSPSLSAALRYPAAFLRQANFFLLFLFLSNKASAFKPLIEGRLARPKLSVFVRDVSGRPEAHRPSSGPAAASARSLRVCLSTGTAAPRGRPPPPLPGAGFTAPFHPPVPPSRAAGPRRCRLGAAGPDPAPAAPLSRRPW